MTDTSFTENPEYQELIQKLQGVHPAIKALVHPDLFKATELAARQQENTNLTLGKLGNSVTAAENKQAIGERTLGIKQDTANLQATTGLGTHQNYWNLRKTAGQDALDLAKLRSNIGNFTGAANVGVGLYGLKAKSDLTDALLQSYGT